jgi:hypothetical protein
VVFPALSLCAVKEKVLVAPQKAVSSPLPVAEAVMPALVGELNKEGTINATTATKAMPSRQILFIIIFLLKD